MNAEQIQIPPALFAYRSKKLNHKNICSHQGCALKSKQVNTYVQQVVVTLSKIDST